MFEYLSPRGLATSQEIIEYLELHQIAQELHLEIEYREQFEQYCEWYYQTAQQHQQDYARMQLEPNLLSLFNRGLRLSR
jgi:hypothetical protein